MVINCCDILLVSCWQFYPESALRLFVGMKCMYVKLLMMKLDRDK